MHTIQKQLLWLVLFSIAMGFLEAAVVVYLRMLYYPEGFHFPLRLMDAGVGLMEILREISTVIMLVGVGILAGRTFNQRLASFVAAFALWDLCYYLFLKLLLGWPESWFTWDILFLIPVPWAGPVLTPCVICLTMLLLATILYIRDAQDQANRISFKEWILLIAGCLIVVLSWTLDYFRFTSGGWMNIPGKTFDVFTDYIPGGFNWWLFGLGELLLIAGIFFFWKRTARD